MIRLWSRKILRVLEAYSGSRAYLVGATGDIDNLGLYVAAHGRASAENLVDIVNHIVGDTLQNFFGERQEDFPAYCFLPSGEEVFVLAVCLRKAAYQKFCAMLDGMTDRIHQYSPIPANEIGITFGKERFRKGFAQNRIHSLIHSVYSSDKAAANAAYLKIMQSVREVLAEDLDKEKFRSLGEGIPAVLCRNLVYQETVVYKQTTREVIKNAERKLASDSRLTKLALQSKASRVYGLNGNDLTFLRKLK